MKIRNPFKNLSKSEWAIYLVSLGAVFASSLAARPFDAMTACASLIGATALIFVAKGDVFGQFLSVIFSIFYGVISLKLRYYGEVITYLCMTAPIALASVVSWIRNPYEDSDEVEVHKLTKLQTAALFILTAAVTAAFFIILTSSSAQSRSRPALWLRI